MSVRWPPEVDRPLLAAAAALWLGVLLAGSPILAVSAVTVVGVVALRSDGAFSNGTFGWLVIASLVVGMGSGLLVAERRSSLENTLVAPGRIEAMVEARTDVIDGEYGAAIVASAVDVSMGVLPNDPLILSPWTERSTVGDRFRVSGLFTPGVTRIRRSVAAGRVSVSGVESVEHRPAIHLRVANTLRERVIAVVRPSDSESRALLAGFLIGDTTGLSDTSIDLMRRAGLTHFVAVSGSNVALFLLLWWMLLGPLGLRGWVRTFAGLAGLVVFAAMTRWEPSVIRASLAAGVLLVGRSIGVPLSSWATLSLAVAGALTIAGELATDVGFQLSVLAACGVLAGSDLWRFRPSFVSTALSASVSAQALVGPLLLVVFGSVPMLSPIANVVAGPLVVAATSLAGFGVVIGSQTLVGMASGFSAAVLGVAEVAAPWPQMDWAGWLLLLGSVVCLARFARGLLVPVIAVLIAVNVWPADQRPDELPAVVFLDVGQGDATLFLDHDLTVLIDGGPDPVVLTRKLERYGVDRLDVVIVSHVHADHIVGLEAVIGRVPVGLIVADFEHHATPAAEWLLSEAERLRIDLVSPQPGWRFGTESLGFEVLGPKRRYASPNDESVVVVATVGDQRVLMSGDIETFAQSELRVPRVDVLKVPHQGAATSDLGWLAAHSGHTSVVSVGSNQFGHPSPDVLKTLTSAGAVVHRTDLNGDLVFAG